LLVCVALGGCRGPKPQGGAAAPAAVLRLVPEQARYVVAMDLARVRAAPITAKLEALRVLFGPAVRQIEAFKAKTGIDPWAQVDSVVLGGVSLAADSVIIVRVHGIDEARVVAYAREELAADGDELVAREYARRTIWSARNRPDVAGVFVDAGTLALAAPTWVERVIDLADGAPDAGSAASNPELVAACAQVSASPIWGAGVLPEEARRIFRDDLDLRAIASLQRMTVSVDLTDAFVARASAQFGDPTQAEELAEDLARRLDRERRAQRGSPYMQTLFKGLTEYVEGSTFRAELRLENDAAVRVAETTARAINWTKPADELPQPTTRALTWKADWLTPPSDAITVSEVRGYDAWDRRTHALIEVSNRTDRPVLPDVRIRYRGPGDKRLEERLCFVPMIVLLPRESAGCDPGVPDGAATGIYAVRTAQDERAAAFAARSRLTLKVVGARLEPARGAVQWLTGEVKNTTDNVVRAARVHATFYDASRKIVGYGDAVAQAQQLAPGAAAPFRLASGPLFAPARSFAAIAYSVNMPNSR
jgi:hypothetical protein